MAALLLCALAAVSGCAHQPPVATTFGAARTLAIGESALYDDGLLLTLEGIADSRCAQGMVCVWAGELSPQLRLGGGRFGETPIALRLGTGRGRDRQTGGYRFHLLQATPATATLVVTRP
jgi:hypothetical protein